MRGFLGFIIMIQGAMGFVGQTFSDRAWGLLPHFFELPTAVFWVQRGYPFDFWAQQPLPAVSQFFDVIDRVEVEFSYR